MWTWAVLNESLPRWMKCLKQCCHQVWRAFIVRILYSPPLLIIHDSFWWLKHTLEMLYSFTPWFLSYIENIKFLQTQTHVFLCSPYPVTYFCPMSSWRSQLTVFSVLKVISHNSVTFRNPTNITICLSVCLPPVSLPVYLSVCICTGVFICIFPLCLDIYMFVYRQVFLLLLKFRSMLS